MTVCAEPTQVVPDALIVYPPSLPYNYTLHHRFQRVWEVADYLRRTHPNLGVVDAGLLNMLQGDILSAVTKEVRLVVFYVEPQLLEVTKALIERLRLMWPQLVIGAYGPAAVSYLDDVKKLGPDAIGVRGDYEQQLIEIMEWVKGGGLPRTFVSTNHTEGWIEPSGPFRFLHPGDWGWPRLEEMPLADIARVYSYKRAPVTMAVTVARGCPFPCAFCSTPAAEGRAERRRPVDGLINYLSSYPAVSDWQLYAPNFTLNRRWVMTFLNELRGSGLRMTWRCTTRADLVDPEMAEAMVAGGCRSVGIGVETIGQSRLQISKGEDLRQTEAAIRLLVALGITVKGYIIVGLPGQTVEEARATIDFVRSLGAEPRPTLYSPQGDADDLVRRGLVAGASPTPELDRKAYIPEHRDGYGEFLRMIYQR